MRIRVIAALAGLALSGAAFADPATPSNVAASIVAQGGAAEDVVILNGDWVMYGRYDGQGFKATLHGCDVEKDVACEKIEMVSCGAYPGSDAAGAANRYNQLNEIGTAFTTQYGEETHICLRLTTLHSETRDFGGTELLYWRQIFLNLNQLTQPARRLAQAAQ